MMTTRQNIQALSDFDLHTQEQKLEPQHLPDTRFLLISYQPVKTDTRQQHRGFMVDGADTIISLGGETDFILIRSDILTKSHPFFRSGFSNRWSSNKLTTPVIIDGCTILYRYELQYEADGTTSLIGKRSATDPAQRFGRMNRPNSHLNVKMPRKCGICSMSMT